MQSARQQLAAQSEVCCCGIRSHAHRSFTSLTLKSSSHSLHCVLRLTQRPKRPLRSQRAACVSVRAEQQQGGRVQPVRQQARAFAPATVANLGVGFDWLGCAVQGDGDIVTATVLPSEPGAVRIDSITGDGGRLPLDAATNCVGIAASETIALIEQSLGLPVACGVALQLAKGLPLGSGLGSSAASAAAAAAAVNGLFGSVVPDETLVLAGLKSEAAVSGYHADNIAPAILGGFTLVRKAVEGEPLDLQRLGFEGPLWFSLVNPVYECPTSEMRAALSPTVTMKQQIHNGAWGATLVAAIFRGDAEMLGRALDSDIIVEPTRGSFIPGFSAVKAAAKKAGAFGCTISGAGPTCVAVTADKDTGLRVAEAMAGAFKSAGGLQVNFGTVVEVDNRGAHVLTE